MQREPNAPHGRPNVVVILADDMGFGDVGANNPDSRIPTPNMDRVAREGMRFLDAHSPSAVCTPTRYGMMTGTYCFRSPLKQNVLYGYEPPLIPAATPTLATLFRDAGYSTACVGKWHLGLQYQTVPGARIDFTRPLPWPDADRAFEEGIDFRAPIGGGPVELGFDRFFGTSGCATCQPPYAFIEGDHFVEPPDHYYSEPHITGRPGMMSPGWLHRDADPTFTREAVRYIESRRNVEQPFFLYLAASAPHEPCADEVVPKHALRASGAGPRGDLVWLFDWMVGEVLSALDEIDASDNTIVIVTSDNGALPGDRVVGADGRETYRTYGHRASGSWRGYKAHIWEGGHREPLLVRWPGIVAAGSTSASLVCLTDLYATFAELFGMRTPDGAARDSRSMLGTWLSRAGAGRESLIHHSGAGVFAVRAGDWKLIHESEGSGGWPPPRGGGPERGAPGQLYNLAEDPRESVNLFAERSAIVQDLTQMIYTTVGTDLEGGTRKHG